MPLAIQINPTYIPRATAAQVDLSTVGKEFHFALPNGPSWQGNPHPVAGWKMFMSSSETGTATIYWANGTTTTVNLIGESVTAQAVSTANMISTSDRGILSAKVNRVVSTVNMSLYGCDFVDAASDCTNFYPTATWGTRYRLLYGKADTNGKFTIVNGDDTSTVTILPKTSFTASPTSFTAGTPVTVTLAPKQVYVSVLSNSSQEFAGTLVTSTSKISIINGHECSSANTTFPGAGGACDTGAQVVPPVSSWGSAFYSVNYKNTNTTGSGYRILADQDSTTVTITGDETQTVTINAGEVYQLHAFKNTGSSPHKSISINSNNPILVAHWFFAGTYTSIEGSDNGDQSMSYVTPFQQYMSSYTVVNPTNFKGSFINVVVPTSVVSTIKLDGATIDQSLFRQVANSNWKSAQVLVRAGTHTLKASQAFGIEVYGIGYFDSYAYTGGQSTADVSSVAALQISAANVNGIVGQQACVVVNVQDIYGSPVQGVRVDVDINGVSGTVLLAGTADSRGDAKVCYTGNSAGTDNVLLTANGYTSNATVTWSLQAPSISYTPSTLSVAVNAAMPTLTPVNTGGTIASWSISPSLSAGLSFDISSGVISGTPTSTSAETYTVTATNSAGSNTSLVRLVVEPGQAPTISYASPIVLILDSATSTISPSISGTYPTWSITPALPDGLNFSTQNGEITGTPSRLSAARNYTITARNSVDSATAVLNLTVDPLAPDISFSPTSYTGYKNIALATINPRNAGSPATSWAITPTLPAGMAFSTSTGSISGTPTETKTVTNYTITATNSAGSDSSTLTLQVELSVPAPAFSYSPSSNIATVGTVFAGLVPTNTGGPTTSWAISPSLPAGLSFSTSNGRISGTSTSALADRTYTVTGTNVSGTSTASFNLASVLPPAPDIVISPSTFTFEKDFTAVNLNGVNNGGAASSWAISPSLPSGLTFNTITGVLSGTPTALLSATNFTISATNLGGTDSATVNITITGVLAPDISYAGSPVVSDVGRAITSLSPTNLGGGISSWSISPSLPSGLTFNTSSGMISGTPAGTLSLSNYTITATGRGGTDTATVTLTFAAPSLPDISISPTAISAIAGTAITTLTPTNTGGLINSWSITPTLPAGLTLNATTGAISGTPTTESATTTFTLTAVNFSGSDTASVEITVAAALSAPAPVTPTPTPSPVQTSKIVSISPQEGPVGQEIVVVGIFDRAITSISVGSIRLFESDWSATSTQITFKAPQNPLGRTTIQIFNGATPLLPEKGFTYTLVRKYEQATPDTKTAASITNEPLVTVDANLKPAKMEPNSSGTGTVVSADNWQLAVAAKTPEGKNTTASVQSDLIIYRGGSIELQGIGFYPSARGDVYIFSNPAHLGTVQIDTFGLFGGEFKVAPDMPLGKHVVQLVSYASDGKRLTISIPVIIVAITPPASLITTKASAFIYPTIAPIIITQNVLVPPHQAVKINSNATLTVENFRVNSQIVKAYLNDSGAHVLPVLVGPKDLVSATVSDGVTSQVISASYSKRMCSLANVNFRSGISMLDPESKRLLLRLAKIIKEKGFTNIQIVGHADSTGTIRVNNQALSEYRATSVFKFLKQELRGVSVTIVKRGVGVKKPLVNEVSRETRAANRRVEILGW